MAIKLHANYILKLYKYIKLTMENTSSTQPPAENPKKQILNLIISKSVKCSKPTLNRVGMFIEAILSLDKDRIKVLSAQGLPDDLPILRSLIWKINLGYLPLNSEEWNNILFTQRKTYNYYKSLFISKLKEEIQLFNDYHSKTKQERKKLEEGTNKVLLEDIAKDVNRTHMQFSFFFQPINKNVKMTQEEIQAMVENRRNCTMRDIKDTYKIDINETHADVLARILFIYSKFSPDVSYVQGMNEIIAPIYYTFSYDKLYEEENENNIEADTFWTFYLLMQKMKYIFNRDEDKSDRGINGKAYRLQLMIKIVDKSISDHFDKYKLDFSFFSFRWFILMFSQDFLMIDILRLWDYIFCEEDIFRNVYLISLALMLMKKDTLLVSDLTGMIEELQNVNGIDIEALVSNAIKIDKYFGTEINKIIENEYL